jgi:hypothetical protein
VDEMFKSSIEHVHGDFVYEQEAIDKELENEVLMGQELDIELDNLSQKL